MTRDPANPWMFRRDEIDAIEDELDEIFDWHDETKDPVNRSVEDAVIDEQERSEDAYERRLAEILGPDSKPEEPHVCEHCKDGFPDGVPIMDLLNQDRDPMYVRAYQWAVRVVAWAKASYWQNGMQNRDMFRVVVNAYLVPVKIAFALSEESRDDEFSPKIAGLEFDLAALYLSRTRESLGSLRAMGLEHADLRWMIQEADALSAMISERRSRFPVL